MTTSNWINLAVAVGTIGPAVMAYRGLRESRAGLRVMEQSATAAEATAEAMRAVANASFRPTVAARLSENSREILGTDWWGHMA